jgi:RsiW-degrading membrane proteinase PrsW (M82 family)
MANNQEDEIEEERDMISLIPEIIALLGGIVSAVLFALPVSYLLSVVPSVGPVFGPIIIAPLVEEPSKIFGVIFLALYYPNSIDNKKRGLILGVMAGLGFAFTENLLYSLVYPQAVLVRAVVPVLIHICASATAALGMALLSKKVNRSLTGFSRFKQINSKESRSFLIIAMLFHFLNNFILIILGDIFWIANLVLDYFILYKLYSYLPERLTGIKITGTGELLSKAIRSKRKEEHQTKLLDFE